MNKVWTIIMGMVSGVALILIIIFSLSEDKTAPVININEENIRYWKNCPDSVLMDGVTAKDDEDGDVTDTLTITRRAQISNNDMEAVRYVAADKSGNVGKRDVIFVKDEDGKYKLVDAADYSVDLDSMQISIKGMSISGMIETEIPTTEPETTTVEETTTEPETTTVEETTTEPETTTVEETTTEPETTTAAETTTVEETTTVPETTTVAETTTPQPQTVIIQQIIVSPTTPEGFSGEVIMDDSATEETTTPADETTEKEEKTTTKKSDKEKNTETSGEEETTTKK